MTRYNQQAVDQAIDQANRRSRVSTRERKMIHALLKGNEPDVRDDQSAS